jgi:hypothetical protein
VSRKITLPAEQHVRDALGQMHAEAADGGARPSVLALARRLGLSNATFWRHFRDIAIELRQSATTTTPPGGTGQSSGSGHKLAEQNAKLRRERDDLADQLQAALAHLRRLTIDNARLRTDLEAARGVTRLDSDRITRQEA